ncbi:MAG: hypothetical protein JRI23_19340 [Deltaproteobacteria bacterium]|jgi:hypothetical protein|nr:hypothetical protein [Deltaproteobacteria bacterium]MBW2534019.1 hypothetical protein [Deltaproteobacteria bacterium]
MPLAAILRRSWWLAICSLPAACGSSDGVSEAPFVVPEGCNPIAAEHDCLLPFPSDVYLTNDPSLPSGRRVAWSEAALPVHSNGERVDLTAQYPADGFSVGTAILALFPEGVDDANLAGPTTDPALSLAADSPTVLLDTETGEPVVHLAELDPRAELDARRALLIRPLVRLEHDRRYVVALRSLRDSDGQPIAAPEGFARLRDGRVQAGSALEPLVGRYDSAIFPPLEAAGIARANLQLAWEFSTESQESVTRDMLDVRDQLLTQFATAGPEIEVVRVEDDVSEAIARRVDGIIRVPMFVESAEPVAPLRRDAAGRVTAEGTLDVPFVLTIPRSVASAGPSSPSARVVQLGHGFFGSLQECVDSVSFFGEPLGIVMIGVDWWGMRDVDRSVIANDLAGDPNRTLQFTDGVHQGMANSLALEIAARGPLAALPEVQIDGRAVFDPGELYFYGISNGGILGGTFMALSPTIERGALGVGGANYGLIAFRSRSFSAFLLVIQGVFPDPLDQQKIVAMWQTAFDRIDPLTYAPMVLDEPLADTPDDRRLLLQIGMGDAAVPNISSHWHARALGVGHLQPAPRPLYGLLPVDSPHDGSALVEWDLGVDPLPGVEAIVGAENGVHDDVRKLAAVGEQLDRFFRPDGTIEHTCDGVCDPE